ncbi:response regulator transcription factor [Pelagicoccus sp. SDUM812003]|uniref:response regulator transcription factor n=1 Tax=Pelagicoccus sp. SDUM812003 TaxID=3041267 RepID=UPI0028106800|nr:response regulator transcription factor [Pelagicoccus sp. SDUM812003]MDQ8202128.1 response regulator transcription factor [Pelagicoccus sp. SDUM812003]
MIQQNLPQRVLLIDEHPVCGLGLNALFAKHGNYLLVQQAQRLRELSDTLKVDLIIVEIGSLMPKGVAALRELKNRYPQASLLVISSYDERLYAERCLKSGASGYLMKTQPLPDLLAAIETVASGGLHVSERVKTVMVNKLAGQEPEGDEPGFDCLSDKELLIIEQIGLSKNNKEIAQALQISVKTIESHRSRIKAKLKLDSPQELMRYAMRMHPV